MVPEVAEVGFGSDQPLNLIIGLGRNDAIVEMGYGPRQERLHQEISSPGLMFARRTLAS